MWKHDKRNNCFEDSAFTVLEFSMGTCGSSWARTMGKEKLPAVWNYTSLFVPNRGMWKKKQKTTAWGKVEDCIGYGDWTTLHTVHGPASVFLVYATVCIAGSMEVKHFSRIARPVRLIYYEVNNISNKMVGFIKFYVFGPSWLLNFWSLPNFLPFSICCKRIAGAQIKMCAATPAKILTFI